MWTDIVINTTGMNDPPPPPPPPLDIITINIQHVTSSLFPGLPPHTGCDYQRFSSDAFLDAGYYSFPDSEALWSPACQPQDYNPGYSSSWGSSSSSSSSSLELDYKAGYWSSCSSSSSLEQESQNIADFTMAQLSQLTPPGEVRHSQGSPDQQPTKSPPGVAAGSPRQCSPPDIPGGGQQLQLLRRLSLQS